MKTFIGLKITKNLSKRLVYLKIAHALLLMRIHRIL